MARPLPATLLAIALGCLACSTGPKNPKYSEEIVGREVVHAGQTAAEVNQPSAQADAPAPTTSRAGASQAPPPSAEVDCGASLPAPAAGAVTDTLQCGGTVTGTTEGGTSSFGDDFYQRAFCSPARQHYDDAPEAVYRLEVPANTQATVELHSPCG